MIEFSEIIGHEDIIQHFKRSIEMGKVSQGYIINGEEGSGKKTLTRAIIKTMECEEGGTEPCCKCKSCKQMDTDNQPDVTWVTHDKPNVISVEEIRDQVNKDITIKPYSSRYKIYVIDDAQLLNANAQNALLKTIEEPPEYAIIFLLTSNIDKILPTIISRCIVLNIKPVRERDVLDYLMNELKLPKEKADFCMDFAQGNLGKAIRLATSDEYKEIIEDVTGVLRKIPDMTVDDIMFAIKNMNHHKLKIGDYIDLMMMWYRDILMLKITGNAGRLMFKEYYTDIRKQSSHISYEGIEDVLKAMDKAKIRLEANVNFDVAMELMLLTIKENK